MSDGSNPDPAEDSNFETHPFVAANDTWQKRWRIIGGISIALCAIMAGLGVNIQALHESKTLFVVYWGVFLLLFLGTLYIVALDLRYIRAQHAIAERDLFQETLGDREFREALNEAVRTQPDDNADDTADPSR